MMEKTFETADVETRVAAVWEAAGAFRAGRRESAEPFCVVIPPPNVTGNLHMGHALNNTLQDILCRYWRMNGKDVLWQPGTDHAGIATQMVVERQLAERQEPDRRTLGREKFLERVWAWKAESGGAIVGQLKRLGASCDWSRERFTLDEGLSKAVAKVFVQLHRDGLVYKAKRLVNWDPKFQTAISDLEVVQVECKGSFKWTRSPETPFDEAALRKALAKNPNGHLYYFDYPVVDDAGEETGDVLTVATTRPETMLGDTAVAVHPEDERFSFLVGKNVRLPLVGRLIRVVADEYSDPEKGTGAVKITPAHDFNDFEVGKRHEAEGVRQINILDAEARVTLKGNLDFFEGLSTSEHELARLIDAVDGVDRFEARKRIVALMALEGRLAKIEPHGHMVPHGDRSNVVIEPWLTDQWYVDAKTLAQPALRAVRDGHTLFTPKQLGKDLFRMAGEHPALVRFAPVVVGPPDPGMGVALGRELCRGKRGAGLCGRARRWRRTADFYRGGSRGNRPGPGKARADVSTRPRCARHLVLLGALAVLDSRLAGRNEGAATLLSDQRSGHRLRHHFLLGRQNDDDGSSLHA